MDARGQPVPWFTYPAIEFLEQFDFSRLAVFEFGAGQSTLFWKARAERVVSVESNASWYARLRDQVGADVDLTLAETAAKYAGRLGDHDETYDVIVIDGIAREECCVVAPAKLRHGGMIILDNAERYPELARILRDEGLLQVDMSGFGPVNGYTWTTSFFFHRAFDFPHRGEGRPARCIGSIPFDHKGRNV